MERLFKPQTRLQRRLYLFWCLFHRVCFGLNDPHDSLPNHDGHLQVGKGCWFSGDVKFIQCNHDVNNPDKILPYEDIVVGDHCWFGANVVVLPNVELGPHTVVAAGAVVTKSFREGYVVLAGVPAGVIKRLPRIQQ